MRLVWTRHAQEQLLDIGRFISRDKPMAGRRWVETLREAAQRAATVPRAGRVVPEVGEEDLREIIVKNYRIVYRVQEDEVWVLSVFESHRLLSSALDTTKFEDSP